MRLAAAVKWYEIGIVSQSKAAEMQESAVTNFWKPLTALTFPRFK
jgi:hypothetical protein